MSMYSSIGMEIDYSGNCKAPIETRQELIDSVKEKMELVDDFLVGKKKLKAKERRELQAHLLSLETLRQIDIEFRKFLDARM